MIENTGVKVKNQDVGEIGFSERVVVDYSVHKKILITGANSYIGCSFEEYAKKKYKDNFRIDTLDLIDGTWKRKNFVGYDAVFHVAGIAHADVGKVSDAIKEKYYTVNTNLAIEVAEKAKKDGVKQFVFMSSMIIYGDSSSYGKSKIINRETIPNPSNYYGDSKWQADKGVRALENRDFSVTVLRPPMIYGKGSKGNYPILAKIAKTLPIFPKVNNQRSMLYIENLCEFLCKIIFLGKGGVFIPQNAEYTQTSQMVSEIAKVSGKQIRECAFLTPVIFLGSKIPGKVGNLINKAFGSLIYAKELSEYPGLEYRVVGFKESIQRTEGGQADWENLEL